MCDRPTRRRAIGIFATTAASLALSVKARVHEADYLAWRGTAMGADARIVFAGADAQRVQQTIALVVAEIDRLENTLSLFRPESEICRLNRTGYVSSPSHDFRRALALATEMSEVTNGLFDPTVQSLWEFYVDWFTANPGRELPSDSSLARARDRVDWTRMNTLSERIALAPNQRITLNGLGQGYVTDRVADLLRILGFDHVFLDLGEQRALGSRDDGSSWSVVRPTGDLIPLIDGALATSEGQGCVLGAAGRVHHLFDPRDGRSPNRWRTITVAHTSAAVADALSTALYVATPHEIGVIASRLGGLAIWATDHDGHDQRWPQA